MKIGVIIQARMQSTRLPGKVLMTLPIHSQKTILDRILERVPEQYPVVIATSTNPADDAIAERYPEVFRGSEENVLNRFFELASGREFDHIVRLTADNPCIDPLYLQKTIEYHIDNKSDYTRSIGLPLGCNPEVFSFRALQLANSKAVTNTEKEHVTIYMREHGEELSTHKVQYSIPGIPADLRLTIDYPSDFAMINLLFCALGESFGLKEVSDFLSKNPWVKDINSTNKQLT